MGMRGNQYKNFFLQFYNSVRSFGFYEKYVLMMPMFYMAMVEK